MRDAFEPTIHRRAERCRAVAVDVSVATAQRGTAGFTLSRVSCACVALVAVSVVVVTVVAICRRRRGMLT